MDPMTMMALGSAAAGGLGSYFSTREANKQAKREQEAINRAIAYLQSAINQDYNGLYGASANVNGMTTGNSLQDALLKSLAQQVQSKEIQAAMINNAVSNKTDAEARNQALLLANNAIARQKSNAINSASRAAIRQGQDMGRLLVNAARQANTQQDSARNNALSYINNNLQRIGSGANMNTGSVADLNRQQATSLYSMAQNNANNYRNSIASLMTKTPQKTSYASSMVPSMVSGAAQGLNLGYQYDRQKNYDNLLSQLMKSQMTQIA